MTTKNNKYIAYVRVSSNEQAERNISIPSQIEQINNYSKQNNLKIKKIYKEENSAFKWKRKIFNILLNDLNKKSDIWWLIIFKFDRLSRNLDDFIKIDKIIREKNLDLLSVTEPMLNSYLWRYLVRDMQNRAILYSEELSFRVKLWIRKKLQLWGNPWWYIPFWYDNINWKFIPNNKAKIVQEFFKIYSYWIYWIREITKILKKDFNIQNLPKLERVLENYIYISKIKKVWKLSNEEYIFWWYEKAWTYTEIYDLKYVIPIISDELFYLCNKIKTERSIKTKIKNITYPKIFKCKCGRNLCRDDKKWILYLRCPKHINNTFKSKCNQKYINIWSLEKDFNNIIYSIIPPKDIRNKIENKLLKELNNTLKNKNDIIKSNNLKLSTLKNKQLEITNSFIENNISKEIFEISTNKINEEIENINEIINSLNDTEKYINATNKTIDYIKILEKLDNKGKELKSSQLNNTLFTIVENLILDNKKVLNVAIKHPFNLYQNLCKKKWWVIRGSNPGPSP